MDYIPPKTVIIKEHKMDYQKLFEEKKVIKTVNKKYNGATCSICRKPLKDHDSISKGVGPECEKLYHNNPEYANIDKLIDDKQKELDELIRLDEEYKKSLKYDEFRARKFIIQTLQDIKNTCEDHMKRFLNKKISNQINLLEQKNEKINDPDIKQIARQIQKEDETDLKFYYFL